MATTLPRLEPAVIELLSKALAGSLSDDQLGRLLARMGLDDPVGLAGSRVRRLQASFEQEQASFKRSNRVLAFTAVCMAPPRFMGDEQRYASCLQAVNDALAVAGFRIQRDGTLGKVTAAEAQDAARQRSVRLITELQRRDAHAEVIRCCLPEYVTPCCFSAVATAVGTLVDRIRAKTGLACGDGELIDQALAGADGGAPLLAFNGLDTAADLHEQAGLASLLRGLVGAFGDPEGAAPKTAWTLPEQEALDVLGLISNLHRRLDTARLRRPNSTR